MRARPAKVREVKRYPRRQRDTGYSSSTWRKVRAGVLERDPICKRCHRSPSTVADHIITRRRGGGDDPANLQGLCAPCHASKTNKHDGGWGMSPKLAPPGAV